MKSVLRKGGEIGSFTGVEENEDEYQLISALSNFPDVVKGAAEKLEPFYITRYAIEVASLYNKFYFEHKIIGEDENVKNFRLTITRAALTVIENCLALLGIKVPERM